MTTVRSRGPGSTPCKGIFPNAESQVSNRVAGVTLMEMLVVIALASILLAIVFPAVGSGLGTLELRSSATRLAAAARYARDQAVYRQKTYELHVDRANGIIAVLDWSGAQSQSFTLPSSLRVAEVLPDDGQASAVRQFFFYPDGGSQQFQIVLASSRRQVAILTDPLTGTAKVEER